MRKYDNVAPRLIPERQDHLSWPLLADVLRETRQRLRDAEWEGRDTARLREDVAYLRQELDRGGTYLVPF